MSTRCPACGHTSVAVQDIESLSDSALLVKLDKRIQLCCQECGWMAFGDIALDRPPPAARASSMHCHDQRITLSQPQQPGLKIYMPVTQPGSRRF